MSIDNPSKRLTIDLYVVAFVAICFGSAVVALKFLDELHALMQAYTVIHDGLSLPRLYTQAVFLLLAATIGLTYHRWRLTSMTRHELEKIIDSINPDVLLVIDSKDKIALCNKAVSRMFGHEPDEVVGRDSGFLYEQHVADGDLRNETRELLEKDGFHMARATGRAKDGRAVDLEVIVAHIEGSFSAVQLLRDITERARAESELLHAKSMLETRVAERTRELTALNEGLQREIADRERAEQEKMALQTQLRQAEKMEAIGRLAGGVAHDFNNLLTTITGFTELSLLDVPEEDPVHENLEQIFAAAERAANLVRKLLLVSRKETMELRPLSLNATIEGLMPMLKHFVGEDITIEVEPAPDVWAVLAHEGSIEQVIVNLVVNARDAMPSGGKVTIRVQNTRFASEDHKLRSGSVPGKYACLSVADTGTGIAEEILEHIFEPFFTSKEAGKGTGLGLSVVYGILFEHGGWIDVDSTLGEGTVFTVYLPAAVNVEGTVSSGAEPAHTDSQGRGERILLLEDEAGGRELAIQVLRQGGYTVVPATTLEEALKIFEAEQGDFSLVFTDMVLPDGNGLMLVDRVREATPELPILITSGHTDEKSLRERIRKDNLPFVRKPYGAVSLLRSVGGAMRIPMSSPGAGTRSAGETWM